MADGDDRERRQLALMRQRIKDLRDGDGIGSVIGDLEALVWQLEETHPSFRDQFLEAWGVLETAYAVELDGRDRGQSRRMPTAADPDISEALHQLDALLDSLAK